MATCNWCKTGNDRDDMEFHTELKRLTDDDGILVLETIRIYRCHKCDWLTHRIIDSERIF